MAKTTAIVLSGGRGKRFGTDEPKQYLKLYDKPVLYFSLNAFQNSPEIDEIVLVSIPDDVEYCRREIVEKYNLTKVKQVVSGGEERYDSVQNGLKASKGEYVLIHDGARPCIDADLIKGICTDLQKFGSAIAAVPTTDTIKKVDADGYVAETLNRKELYNIQTPQGFIREELMSAYEKMREASHQLPITDDSMIMENFSNRKMHISKGSYSNIKITYKSDIEIVMRYIEK